MNKLTVQRMSRVAQLALLVAFAAAAVGAQPPAIMSSKDVAWSAAPPVLPKGAMIAILSGDPAATGPVVLRLKLPAGYKIPAHWHPTDEQITVLSGTFFVGMGDKLDAAKGQAFTSGGFAVAVAHMNHYAWTTTGATVQVNMMGPFQITYVDPADNPGGAKSK